MWEGVTAGTISEQVATAYLIHASTCKACSELLEAALAPDLSPPSAEELAFLELLPSSSVAGQQKIAAKVFERARSTANGPNVRRKISRWQVITLAIAAATLLAAVLIVPRLKTSSDDGLLAQAYDRNRLSELRIPGSNAVDLTSPTRGADDAPNESLPLLEAKTQAEKEFAANPNDAALRQRRGEIAIVEHNGEFARREFEIADALNPKLPRLKFDTANAYFVLAEKENRPLDYARAIDLYSQYLQDVNQQDAVALFNRGLCWERQSVTSEAVKDFEAALALETNARWRQEIQRHIDKLKSQSKLDVDTTPYTPSTLLALKGESPGDYENFLDAAGREWLPHRGDDPQTAAALQKLAAMGSRHGDLWLQEFLAAPAVPSGDGALSEAFNASANSRYKDGEKASREAIQLYQKANNVPGGIRARAELIYTRARIGNPTGCLTEANKLDSDPILQRYAWINTYNKLQINSCLAWIGEHGAAVGALSGAIRIAHDARLTIIGLRATGFHGANQYADGDYGAAWKSSSEGLSGCYTARGTFMRRYQFLDNMERVASVLDLKWTQSGLAEAAADSAVRTSNLQIAAYALESDGVTHLTIGETAPARRRFDEADKMLDRLGNDPTAKKYRADWLSDRTALIAVEQGPAVAMAAMDRGKSELQGSNAVMQELRFAAQYARLLRQSGRLADSVTAAWEAVAVSENLLANVQGKNQRPDLQDLSDPAYRVLVLNLAHANRADDALRAWEWYRSARYRSAVASRQTAGSDPASSVLHPVPLPSPGRVTIVYARLEDRYVGWAMDSNTDSPVRFHVLPASAAVIDLEAAAFNRLCSDRTSSPKDLGLLGQALDRDLIAPFAEQIDRAETVQFELDSSLANIPFAAIQHEGKFLGLTHPLVFLPAGWPMAAGDAESPDSIAGLDTLPDQPRLLVIRQDGAGALAAIPDEYDESAEIAHSFRNAATEKAILSRDGDLVSFFGAPAMRGEIASAEVMHYTGHGLQELAPSSSRTGTPAPLGRHSLLRCRLAVLAACRTLDQKNESAENTASFARVVLDAGASHVLASQWDVDSRLTDKLMIRFYSELANHQTFSEALRRAQQSVESTPEGSHPYFWSAFQLVGQPSYPSRGKV